MNTVAVTPLDITRCMSDLERGIYVINALHEFYANMSYLQIQLPITFPMPWALPRYEVFGDQMEQAEHDAGVTNNRMLSVVTALTKLVADVVPDRVPRHWTAVGGNSVIPGEWRWDDSIAASSALLKAGGKGEKRPMTRDCMDMVRALALAARSATMLPSEGGGQQMAASLRPGTEAADSIFLTGSGCQEAKAASRKALFDYVEMTRAVVYHRQLRRGRKLAEEETEAGRK